MLFTNIKPYENLELNSVRRQMTGKEYAEYLQVPLKDEGEIEVRVALLIRDINKVLCTKDTYVTDLEMKCYLYGRNPIDFTNNYMNVASRIAEHLQNTLNQPKEILARTHLEPHSVVRTSESVYLVFELFVNDVNDLTVEGSWADIKELKNNFKKLTKLDTILIPNLLTVGGN